MAEQQSSTTPSTTQPLVKKVRSTKSVKPKASQTQIEAIDAIDACGVCGKAVDDSHKAMQCDDCDVWHHILCIGMPSDVYAMIGKQNNVNWFCKPCAAKSSRPLIQLIP